MQEVQEFTSSHTWYLKVRAYDMDVNMTKSVAFYVKNRGNFRGFFTINTTSIYAVFLDLCLHYAYNKGFYVINHIKTTKMGFFMVKLSIFNNQIATGQQPKYLLHGRKKQQESDFLR